MPSGEMLACPERPPEEEDGERTILGICLQTDTCLLHIVGIRSDTIVE